MKILNKQILISGANGYIGSNLIRHISNLNDNIIITKRTSDTNFEYFNLNNQKFSIENFTNSEIIFVHLATFFSKNKEDEKKLKFSNLEFGKSIVKDLESFNLSKVIYTNTMYQHYKDKKIRQLMYTKTKSDFHNPKLIVATGTSWAKFFSSVYKMKHIKTLRCETDKRNRNIIHHYEFKEIPFIFTPHWSSGYISNFEKKDIKSYLSMYL